MDSESTGARYTAPYVVSAVCAGAGLVLRVVSGPGAVAVAVAVPLAAAAVIGIGHRLGRPIIGVDRRVEVGYVTAVLAALSGWTSAAGSGSWPVAAAMVMWVVGVCATWAAYDLWHRPTGLSVAAGVVAGIIAGAFLDPAGPGGLLRWAVAWWVGTTCAALPYWVHAMIRAHNRPPQVDLTALTAAIDKHLHSPVTLVPHSLNVGTEGRYTVRYRLSDGRTVYSVQAIIAAVESELGLRPQAVMVKGAAHRRDEITVSVTPVEPTTEATMPDLPTSIVEPAPLGVHDNGEPLLVRLYRTATEGASGLLAGGIKGFGKSRALWTLMKSWTHCDDVLFVVADLSGGATSRPWQPCLHWVETEPGRVLPMVKALRAEATARAAILGEMGWESWRPSPTHPAIVFVIDEAQSALKDVKDPPPGIGWEVRAELEQLMQVDRKSGISVVICSPMPSQDEGISPLMREQCLTRLCLRSAEKSAAFVLGGTPALAVAVAATEFDQPGQVLAAGSGIAPVPARTYDTDLAEARRIAEVHAARRPSPQGLLTEALRHAGRSTPGPGPGKGTATPPASAVSDTALADQIRAMVDGPGVLGQPWPDLPDLSERRSDGRMSTEAALAVMAAMIKQAGAAGVSPADLVAVTGYSRQWVHKVLGKWRDTGKVENPDTGRWIPAKVAA